MYSAALGATSGKDRIGATAGLPIGNYRRGPVQRQGGLQIMPASHRTNNGRIPPPQRQKVMELVPKSAFRGNVALGGAAALNAVCQP